MNIGRSIGLDDRCMTSKTIVLAKMDCSSYIIWNCITNKVESYVLCQLKIPTYLIVLNNYLLNATIVGIESLRISIVTNDFFCRSFKQTVMQKLKRIKQYGYLSLSRFEFYGHYLHLISCKLCKIILK